MYRINLPDMADSLSAQPGENLLDLLRNGGINVAAPCNGGGRCGKCRVLTDNGFILACQTVVNSDMTISYINDETNISIPLEPNEGIHAISSGEGYGVACDIGTTTVALELYALSDGAVMARKAFANRQRRYGADVVSRIKASNDGHSEVLRDLISGDIVNAIWEMVSDTHIPTEDIKDISIAGNTTMIHLLMGFDCGCLGAHPFQPNQQLMESYSFNDVFRSGLLSSRVHIVPWISAFVGGDITAGLLNLKEDGRFLLIDMGTNGEMALYNNGRYLCSSAAAGPAFEGGNLTCGAASVPGAICSVDCNGNTLSYKTIGDLTPIGICGSGALDLAACLLRGGFMDESGLLSEDYFENGFVLEEMVRSCTGNCIVFTQKDIRELQLAKSAVRSGIEILLEEEGLDYRDIDKVFLSGGFGRAMRTKSAVAIGLLPKELACKVTHAGNTSLSGAAEFLLCKDKKRLNGIITASREINLATHRRFNEYFMTYMDFESII